MLLYLYSNIIFINYCLLLLKKIGFIVKNCLYKRHFLFFLTLSIHQYTCGVKFSLKNYKE